MGGLRYWKDGREVPDVLLGMFQYPDSQQHPGFNLSLRCNFVDGTSGSTYLKIVGSKGSMDVKWDEVVVKTNQKVSSNDPFMEAQAKMRGDAPDRKKILPPNEMVYKVEPGYKGEVVENPIFAFRAAAPALLCNDSYFQDKFIKWDPVNMKLV